MGTTKLAKDYTHGNIARQLAVFSLPFMASNVLQVLYTTVDMIIVGRFLGSYGLSAVSQSSQFMNCTMMFCVGFANAGQVLVAQALGAGKHKKLSEIIGTMFTVVTALAFIIVLLILIFAGDLMTIVKMPVESYDMSVEYLTITNYGLIFAAGYNMISAVFRGMGDSKRPFLFIAIASVVNIVLDIIFVGPLDMGVAGAAWATTISQVASFAFALGYFFFSRNRMPFSTKLSDMHFNKTYGKMMMSLGMPLAIQSGVINISMLYVNSLVNQIGVVASATFGVGCRIDDIYNKITMGIQLAASTMIGQNIAACEYERVKKIVKTALVYAGSLAVLFLIIYITCGKQLFALFTTSEDVLNMSGEFIKGIAWIFPAISIMRGTNAFIQGIGNGRMSFIVSMLDGVILRIGLSWLFGLYLNMGFFGFVFGYALAPYGCAIPGLIYFFSNKWTKRTTYGQKM